MNNILLSVWLASQEGLHTIEPVVATIGDNIYHGCQFRTDWRRTGEPCQQPRIALLGHRPVHPRQKTCYAWADREWFQQCYYDYDDRSFWHPFGAMFILKPWWHKGGKPLDWLSQRPWDRVPMKVEALTRRQAS